LLQSRLCKVRATHRAAPDVAFPVRVALVARVTLVAHAALVARVALERNS